MIVRPVAKINLGLNVVERRPDGYHNLETVFYPVPLCDTLEVEVGGKSDDGCTLTLGGVPVEGDPRRNLVVRAYDLLHHDFPQMGSVRANLFKQIPTQAGMGGGSSDCAAMLVVLNRLFELHLTEEQLIGYAARLGADCPFFIVGQPAYAEGIGERLQPIDLDLSSYWIAIVRPDIPVPTKEAFSLITPQRPAKNCRIIVSQPVDTWRNELLNDFEYSVFALHPEIGALKERLYDLGADYAAMSGSGSAVFGLFRGEPAIAHSFGDAFTRVLPLA